MPLPRPDTTPPVTKIYFVIRFCLFPFFLPPGARPTARRFLMRFYTSTVPVNTSTALPVISTVSPV